MFVFGIPLSFFLPLIVHALARLTTVITDIAAFSMPKRRGRHPRWGVRYLWAYTVVFLMATILSGERWSADAYLFFIALVGYEFALGGYAARRFRREPWLMCLLGKHWVIAHSVGTIGSYIVLFTGFYKDRAREARPGLSLCSERAGRSLQSASAYVVLVNRLKVRPKMSVDSPCVEPSPKFFRGRRFDTTSTL
jgi:hypothetical protein